MKRYTRHILQIIKQVYLNSISKTRGKDAIMKSRKSIHSNNHDLTISDADMALLNGKIHTIDEKDSIEEAVVIKDGIITFVGKNKDAKRYIGKNTKVVDLSGKVALPGFIETHIHAPGTAYTTLYDINLNNITTVDEVMIAIESFVNKNPQKSMYYGRGYIVASFDGQENTLGPRKERLDRICANKPIILTDYGGHVYWLNSKAFEHFGITNGLSVLLRVIK